MHIYNKTNKEIVAMASSRSDLPTNNPSRTRGVSDSHENGFYSTERSEIPFLSRVRISLAVSLTR